MIVLKNAVDQGYICDTIMMDRTYEYYYDGYYLLFVCESGCTHGSKI